MSPAASEAEELGLGAAVGSEEAEDSFQMDMTQPDPVYPVYPKGWYPMEIASLEYKMSSNNNPMWSVKARVTDEATLEEARGSVHYINVTFTPKAIARVREFLHAIGRDDLNGVKISPAQIAGSGELLDLKFRGRLDFDMYKGKKKNKVGQVAPAGQSMANVVQG